MRLGYDRYRQESVRLIEDIDFDAIYHLVYIFLDAWHTGKRVFFLGNGGSASTASHFALDYAKLSLEKSGKALSCVCLAVAAATGLAIGNDSDFTKVFATQLAMHCPEGDEALVALSGSGTSPNVLAALPVADDFCIQTIGLSGNKPAEASLANQADLAIVVDSQDMQHIEDVHVYILHAALQLFLAELPGKPAE